MVAVSFSKEDRDAVRIHVVLYEDQRCERCVGFVTFTSLIPSESNILIVPSTILSLQEVEEIRLKLCRLPQVNKGTVGKYTWKASNKTPRPLPSLQAQTA